VRRFKKGVSGEAFQGKAFQLQGLAGTKEFKVLKRFFLKRFFLKRSS
jgi:hypothetical protein